MGSRNINISFTQENPPPRRGPQDGEDASGFRDNRRGWGNLADIVSTLEKNSSFKLFAARTRNQEMLRIIGGQGFEHG
jgi:hypothetical protein